MLKTLGNSERERERVWRHACAYIIRNNEKYIIETRWVGEEDHLQSLIALSKSHPPKRHEKLPQKLWNNHREYQ